MKHETSMTSTPSVAPADAPLEDVRELIARVADLERTQRQEDVAGFLELFDAQAVWVTGGGKRLTGLDAIGSFTQTVLPGAMADGSVRYEVEHILFITPDVALTGIRQQYTDLEDKPTSAGLPSYVWKREGRKGNRRVWKIVAGQNTVVP